MTTAAEPSLAAPPSSGALHDLDPYLRRGFRTFNRWFMVPLHRAGLSQWLGSPFGGWMLLLRVRGRRSGLVRETPLSYLLAEGSVWIMAGFGERTEWYRNLVADPRVEVRLPGRLITGRAVEVRDPETRLRILPELVRATGIPGFMSGVNAWVASPDAVVRAVDFVPLIRIDPDAGPLGPGPDDPGGRAWVWRQGVLLAATVLVLRGLWRLAR